MPNFPNGLLMLSSREKFIIFFIPQQFIAYFETTALGYSTAFVSREWVSKDKSTLYYFK